LIKETSEVDKYIKTKILGEAYEFMLKTTSKNKDKRN